MNRKVFAGMALIAPVWTLVAFYPVWLLLLRRF